MEGNPADAAAITDADASTDVTTRVISFLRDLGAEDVGVDTELAALDFDSLMLSYIFAYFERVSGIEFGNDDLMADQYVTVADLCAAIEAKIRAGQA
jgi:acyl carrier protein